MSFIGAPPGHHASAHCAGVRPGFAALAAKNVEGVTQIADLAQFTPLRLLFPRVPDDEPLTACLSNTGGGVVGGDVLDVEIAAQEGARVLALGQAAEKIYRSAGGTARLVGNPIRMSETPPRVASHPPTLGEHTDAVLRDVLGYGDEQVAALRGKGVV